MIASASTPQYTSIGLSARAHILVLLVVFVGAFFLLRLLQPAPDARQVHAALDVRRVRGARARRVPVASSTASSRFLHIYYAPTTLFLVAIGFLLLVCIYFSYELSRLEERTRVLAEELAILRAEQEQQPATRPRGDAVTHPLEREGVDAFGRAAGRARADREEAVDAVEHAPAVDPLQPRLPRSEVGPLLERLTRDRSRTDGSRPTASRRGARAARPYRTAGHGSTRK